MSADRARQKMIFMRNVQQVPEQGESFFNAAMTSIIAHNLKRGRPGFDVDYKTQGACRGTDYLVNPAVTLLVANDDNYALAA